MISEPIKVKCKLCKKDTLYDCSIGNDNFTVCDECATEMIKILNDTLTFYNDESGVSYGITEIVNYIGNKLND